MQGNYAVIKVDGIEITIKPNELGHHRGLNIVVINPKDGIVEEALAFDTYLKSENLETWISEKCFETYKKKTGTAWNDFEWKIAPYDGFIIAIACKDDCMFHLSDTIKEWI